MPTRPDPEQPDPARPDEGQVLEPIRVLRPRRTDALAELFKEMERDGAGYESVALPGSEDATQELPPVAAATRSAPRVGGARPEPAVAGPGFRRAAIAVTVAAAVLGFGGALLLSGRDDGSAARAPAPSATASPPPVACTASFRTVNSWQGGFQGEVTVTNTPAASVSGWTATVVPADGARLTQVWDGTLTTSRDGTATVANEAWNGKLAPGASVTFGFLADTPASDTPAARVSCAATADAS